MIPTHPQVDHAVNAIYSDFVRKFARSPEKGSRFVIYGNNGSGKSRIAKKMVHWVDRICSAGSPYVPFVTKSDSTCDSRPANALFVGWPERVKGMYSGNWEPNDALIDASLLCVDDIGAEHDPKGIAKIELYFILERRERKWTIFTTNHPPDVWVDKFERRIASRLYRNCISIPMDKVPDFNSHA
jgi:hypothetical protein